MPSLGAFFLRKVRIMPDQWHCYKWVGRTAELKDEQRSNPREAVPPNLCREWINKPKSMRKASYPDINRAQTWLREAIREYEATLPPSAQFLSSFDDQAANVARAAANSSYHAGIWTCWQRDGSSLVEFAIVGE